MIIYYYKMAPDINLDFLIHFLLSFWFHQTNSVTWFSLQLCRLSFTHHFSWPCKGTAQFFTDKMMPGHGSPTPSTTKWCCWWRTSDNDTRHFNLRLTCCFIDRLTCGIYPCPNFIFRKFKLIFSFQVWIWFCFPCRLNVIELDVTGFALFREIKENQN